jgi:hypothetical protein
MRWRRSVVALVLLGAAVGAAASAATRLSRPPGSPDLAAMAFALYDLPAGGKVTRQGYKRSDGYVAAYERLIALDGGRVGSTRLIGVLDVLTVVSNAGSAKAELEQYAAAVTTKSGRSAMKRTVGAGLTEQAGFGSATVTVGKPRRIAIGDGAVSLLFRLHARNETLDVVLVVLRVDRVLGAIGLFGVPNGRVARADADRIARVGADRMRAGLVPRSVAPPMIAGTPQLGQTLTAGRGAWSGDQLAFAYQWQRCDAAGAGCADITGAASPTYAVAADDVGATIRVKVTGSNGLGSVGAVSAQTPVVAQPATARG